MQVRLSSLTDYAVVILTARRPPPRGRTAVGDRAGRTDRRAAAHRAQKLMGRLAASGLLTSARGTGGGFLLARAPAAISLSEIVEAVEGPIAMTICVDESRHDCALEGACLVKPHWSAVNAAVRGALDGVSLATLAGMTETAPMVAGATA